MNQVTPIDCLVCRKHRGEVTAPGGAIYEDDVIFVSHAQLWGNEQTHYIGHIFIEPKRHIPELADLSEAEAGALGVFTSRVAHALMQVLHVEHVYSFVIGDGVPHVHVHVIGRYPGAPREYWGTKVDEGPDAPKGDAAQLAQVASQLRTFFAEHHLGSASK
jgi:histidine triad (HIT) family protein